MNIMHRLAAILVSLAAAIIMVTSHIGATAAHSRIARTAEPRPWNEKSAAAYLDRRQAWWMEWPRAKRDHGTFCAWCHTRHLVETEKQLSGRPVYRPIQVGGFHV